jgi:hypothetical protein
MSRRHELEAMCGWLPPLRQYWRQVNRQERAKAAAVRADRKKRDKKRRKCGCEAYPWPHRPGGGFCRWPDPPLQKYVRKPRKRHRERYVGLLRQIARNNGLHPIRDRATIEAIMPKVLLKAKQLHAASTKVKYRNIVIKPDGITAEWQTAGPRM